MWIKFIFVVAIPNIRSILNNLPSRVDPRLEAVSFFGHVFNAGLNFDALRNSVHSAVEGTEKV